MSFMPGVMQQACQQTTNDRPPAPQPSGCRVEPPESCTAAGAARSAQHLPAARAPRLRLRWALRSTGGVAMKARRLAVILMPALFALLFAPGKPMHAAEAPQAKYPDYPSETPAKFVPATADHDYIRREVMIPMRDGVKLHTVILIPGGAHGAGILLTRTPYDANALTSHHMSGHLGPMLEGYDNAADIIVEDGYIRVVQDVRGKYGSEGGYVMNRPLHGPLNPTPVGAWLKCATLKLMPNLTGASARPRLSTGLCAL